jgi:plastocyanin
MRRPLALLVLGPALLAGCGGDGEDKQAPEARATTIQSGAPLQVRAEEYSFDPGRVTIAGAPRAGAVKLEIDLDNRGDLAHNLKLEREGEEIGGTPTFVGGQPRSGTVSVKPGRYTMVCTVGDHAQRGMRGELDVRAGK